jgi:hypothetical protein
VGEVLAVERAPIVHETRDGKGILRIGEVVSAGMEPFRRPDGHAVAAAAGVAALALAVAPAWMSAL